MQLDRMQEVLAAARGQGIITSGTPAAIFYDLDEFRATIGHIRAAFPPSSLHTIAVKANPLAGMLRFGNESAGAGSRWSRAGSGPES